MLSKQEQDLLVQASQVKEMASMPGWETWLEPWLKAKRDQAFPDPLKCQSSKEFLYEALASSALKKATAEILMYVEGQKEAFDSLMKKKKDKAVNKFEIGG